MTEAATMREALQARLGYRFRHPELLVAALTHASAAHAVQPRASERLEFLGDAVLGLVLSELLIARYPAYDEGKLSKCRAALVNTGSFADKAREVGLDAQVTLGKGEEKTGGRTKPSILAAVFESVMGAIFLDGGYGCVRAVVSELFHDAIGALERAPASDPKTELQELCQEHVHMTPVYRVVGEAGPHHARHFVIDVVLGDRVLARGEGRSKRMAEQAAARGALAISVENLRKVSEAAR